VTILPLFRCGWCAAEIHTLDRIVIRRGIVYCGDECHTLARDSHNTSQREDNES
jgi:hypothetical protein